MSFLQKLLGLKRVKKHAVISVLGPSQAGKTTLIRFLETGEPQLEEPLSTLGIAFRQEPVRMGNWELKLIDVGGQKLYQTTFWEFSIEKADGLVYVVDATIKPETHPERFKEQLEQYLYALGVLPEETPMMILLNKQDLVDLDPITPDNFGTYYPLESFLNRTVTFLPTSAKYGDGVTDAFNWFIQEVEESLNGRT